MDPRTPEPPACLELSFAPNVELVSTIRHFVESFYEQILQDPDITSRLGVAAHEMLENAVKFSVDGETHIRVEVQRFNEGHRVSITTRNRADPTHLTALRETLDGIAQAPDAMAYYLDLMRRSAKRKDGSGLGLGRICAEAEMRLDYRIDGNLVQLQATGQ